MAEQPSTNIPIPDPSLLTTEQISRTTQALRVEINLQLVALRDALTTRLDGMDKATVLLAETVNRVPTVMDREIHRLSEMFSEKMVAAGLLNEQQFGTIDKWFHEKDARTEERKAASATAITAAFEAERQAAGAQQRSNEQAIAKSETSVNKQIEDLKLSVNKQFEDLKSLFNSKNASTDEKIATNGERLTRIESLTRGMADQKDDQRASSNTGMQAVLLIITVISVMAAIATPFLHHS